MTATVYLVRHGHHALVDRVLCGRMAGITLDDTGRRQMEQCAAALPGRPVAISASPQQRAWDSAEILARRFDLALSLAPAFDEIDYGEWTGRSFAELAADPAWHRWNNARGTARPPGGENMRGLQARVVEYLQQLRSSLNGAVVIVSHAEPIRAALLHHLQLPLDAFHTIAVEPGSISTLVADSGGFHLSPGDCEVPA